MKNLGIILSLVAFAVAVQAAPKKPKKKPSASSGASVLVVKTQSEVSALMDLIGNASLGVEIHKVAGQDVQEMITNLAQQDDPDMEFVWDRKDWPADEGTWGTFETAYIVNNGVGFDEGSLNSEDGDSAELAKAMAEEMLPLLKKAAELGLVFGHNSYGYGYCGVTFPNLLIIDVENQVIYEVSLGKSGPC